MGNGVGSARRFGGWDDVYHMGFAIALESLSHGIAIALLIQSLDRSAHPTTNGGRCPPYKCTIHSFDLLRSAKADRRTIGLLPEAGRNGGRRKQLICRVYIRCLRIPTYRGSVEFGAGTSAIHLTHVYCTHPRVY